MRQNQEMFPGPATTPGTAGMQHSPSRGIHVRDWIATQCLQGILSTLRYSEIAEMNPHEISQIAYKYADALIEESEREPSQNT